MFIEWKTTGKRFPNYASQQAWKARNYARRGRKNWKKIKKLKIFCKISSSGNQVQIFFKINVESELYFVVFKTLPYFEVLCHGKQTHQLHGVTKVQLLFFII
jgi:hypothetical protein